MKNVCKIPLLFGAFVAAFSQPTLVAGQSELSKQIVAADPPFALTISYNQQNPSMEKTADQVVKNGQWVSFRIRKTNISNYEIAKTSHVGGSYGYDFEVRDGSGNLVGPKKPNEVKLKGDDRGAAASGTKDAVLQPGESKIDFVPLGRWFNMSAPGTYTIQAMAHTTDDPNSDVVKSNILTITVLPADGPHPTQ